MFHSSTIKKTSEYKLSYKIICFLFISFFLSGCVTGQANRIVGSAKQASLQTHKNTHTSPRVVKAIYIMHVSGATEVLIRGNGKLAYTSVKQSFPLGIAVYLPQTSIAEKCSVAKVSPQSSINSISALYADRKKTSVKVQILLKKDFNYEVIADNSDIKVLIHDRLVNKSDRARALTKNENKVSGQNMKSSAADLPVNIIKKDEQKNTIISEHVKIPDTPAILTAIDFTTSEDGSSAISIKTSHPVKYDIVRDKKKNILILNLGNTDIPDYRQRPLITKYFKSAVNRIVPVERTAGENLSHIIIELRESVPFRVVRNNDNLILFFEPSDIPPPVFTKAEKIVKGGVKKTIVTQVRSKRNFNHKTAVLDAGSDLLYGKKVYTGEKIRLDFFETDIKNVFRILSAVSGKNFAVDNDVTGNVTLALDKPVPWDQVLDLVLKMNGLGKVEDHSIIRIATQKTLIQEQKNRQAEFAARKLAMTQKKSLEPLITEYLSINYANAATDIAPHLKKILTPKRGHLSVDKRTNIIIMTDVKEKLDQAKQMIHKLDKVTPQIMIAARIVEVTKNFSKSLGIDWSISNKNNDAQWNALGGTYGFDVAMNYPVASAATLGYTFTHIVGTPFALNAKLSASETKGDVKIISSPKILTLDNKKAKIKQGLEYPYQERDKNGVATVKFKNIDLLLEVTPHVTADNRISMNIHLTKNDVASVLNGVPSLSTNEADTELLVNDGNTIVIGGITKATKNISKSGFPGLSSIPFLGKLFGSNITTDNRNELLIFITPTIVHLQRVRN